MGYRARAFIYSLLVVIAALGAIFLITQVVVIKRFSQLEGQDILQDVQRTRLLIEHELEDLDNLNKKWIVKDQTRLFLQSQSSHQPISSQLAADVQDLGVDVALFFDAEERLVYGRVVNPLTGKTQSVPADLRTLPVDFRLQVTNTGEDLQLSGFTGTSLGLMMISAQPVEVPSSSTQAIGWLVFGRFFDQTFITEIGELANVSVDARELDNLSDFTEDQKVLTALIKSPDHLFVQPPEISEMVRGRGAVSAYFSIDDLSGEPLLIARVNNDHNLYQLGVNTLRSYGLVIILIGLLIGGAAYNLFSKMFVTRLKAIEDGVSYFNKTRDFNRLIQVEGEDEISSLAEKVNAAILELGRYQEGQVKSERQFREALQNLSLAAVILDPDGRIMFCNDHILNMSGYHSSELLEQYWWSKFIPEGERSACRREILDAAKNGRITAHEDSEFILRNGSTRTFSWSNTLLSTPDGVVTGIVRIGEDVTERRKAESMLRESLQETRLHLTRLTALRRIDSAITSTMNISAKIENVLSTIQDSLEMDAVDILRIDADETHLIPIASKGLLHNSTNAQPLISPDPLITKLRLEHQPYVLVNPSNTTLPDWTRARLDNNDRVEFYGAAPMVSGNKLIGILEVFARHPVEKDKGWLEHFQSMALQATITLENEDMIQGIQRANTELEQAYEGTLIGWARALELRDKETRGHSERMMDLTVRLGRRLGMHADEMEVMARGVLLHDIGKMGVPDYILHKPGPLTDDEWVVMRQHPQFAFNLLKNIPYLSGALEVAFCHHEHWDGTGYPRGLQRDEIPFSARVFAIVDVWDALTHDRPYRPAWTEEEALDFIQSQSGLQFDPKVVKAFVKMQQDIQRQTSPLPVHITLD